MGNIDVIPPYSTNLPYAVAGEKHLAMQDADAERAARMQSMLRLNISIRDGPANVYWKHDGERFSSKSKGEAKPADWRSLCSGSTLKLCTGRTYQLTLTSNRPAKLRDGSGRWEVKEIDAEGREVQPQFEVRPPPPPPPPPLSSTSSQLPGHPLPLSTPPSLLLSPPSQSLSTAAVGDGPGPGAGGSAVSSAFSGAAGSGGNGDLSHADADPRALQWADTTSEAARSTYTAALTCSLAPTAAGRRQYLLLEAYVEDFGLVVCPLQIKVYKPSDKGALSSFALRFVQFDFREDSSSVGALFAVNYFKY